MENLNQDSPLRLADALADEIAKTPAQTLLGEVTEDFGDRRALAREFDTVAARALHQSRRRQLATALKNAVAWLSQRALGKSMLVRVGTLAVLVVAAGGYYYQDARRAVSPIAPLDPPAASQRQPAMPPSLSAYSDDDPGNKQTAAAANQPAAPSPSPQVQSNLEKAEAAYDTARAEQARVRANEAFDRGDYGAAIASLNDALRSCTDHCQPELRGGLDSDLARAQTALNTNPAAAVAAAPSPAVQAVAAAAPPQSSPSLTWPAQGRVAVSFGARTALAVADAQARASEGISIAVPEGAAVRAAADGVVSYVGSEQGSGKFVLIRHDNDLKTGYGHLRKVMVKVSDQVHSGEVIAKGVVRNGAGESRLYFELRNGSAAIDPMQRLPPHQ